MSESTLDLDPSISSDLDAGFEVPSGSAVATAALPGNDRESISDREPSSEREPTRVVTVRMPQSLHTRLLDVAHSKRVSMNAYCLDSLLAAMRQSADASAGE